MGWFLRAYLALDRFRWIFFPFPLFFPCLVLVCCFPYTFPLLVLTRMMFRQNHVFGGAVRSPGLGLSLWFLKSLGTGKYLSRG